MPLTTAHPTFRTEPKPFAAAVSWVAKHLPNRPVVPVLAGILLEVEDGRVTVSAFDYEVAVRTCVAVVGETDGRVLVSGRLLATLVATFPNKPIDVTCSGAELEIVCGSIRVTLPTLPVEDYPQVPAQPPAIGTVAAAAFAEMVERVAIAADRNAAVVWQTAVRVAFEDNEIDMLANNRYRAAIGRLPWQLSGAEHVVLLSMPVLVDAAKVLAAAETVTIGVDPSGLVGFTTDDLSITVRQLDCDYPIQVRGLFPARDDTPLTAPIRDLADALKRSSLVRGAAGPAAGGPALLTFTEGGLAIHTQGDKAKTAEAVDCTTAGQEVTFAINPQLLADALTVLPGDTVEFTVTSPLKPVLLTTPDDKGDTYTHLIVPIRTS
jgi:DNA polymerase-3 subunit beta